MQNNPNTPFDRESIKELLDRTYELEGLLLMALSRDELPLGLDELISSKLAALTGPKELEDITGSDAPKDVNAPEDPKDIVVPNAPEALLSDSFDNYDLDDDEPAPVTQAITAPQAPEALTETKDQPAPQAESAPAVAPAPTVVPAPVAAPAAPRQTPVFSINDRFLFTRELFGGRMADFEEALKDVASMESYDEAEEYFISERGFNTELPIVQDFLNVIANCFT